MTRCNKLRTVNGLLWFRSNPLFYGGVARFGTAVELLRVSTHCEANLENVRYLCNIFCAVRGFVRNIWMRILLLLVKRMLLGLGALNMHSV